ncbi:MAG: hypothetical protein H0U71_04210 [Gammaproteobacteria bacterium]|nr:hypothetical protein [Gammaproteobacteria bacterium]
MRFSFFPYPDPFSEFQSIRTAYQKNSAQSLTDAEKQFFIDMGIAPKLLQQVNDKYMRETKITLLGLHYQAQDGKALGYALKDFKKGDAASLLCSKQVQALKVFYQHHSQTVGPALKPTFAQAFPLLSRINNIFVEATAPSQILMDVQQKSTKLTQKKEKLIHLKAAQQTALDTIALVDPRKSSVNYLLKKLNKQVKSLNKRIGDSASLEAQQLNKEKRTLETTIKVIEGRLDRGRVREKSSVPKLNNQLQRKVTHLTKRVNAVDLQLQNGGAVFINESVHTTFEKNRAVSLLESNLNDLGAEACNYISTQGKVHSIAFTAQ